MVTHLIAFWNLENLFAPEDFVDRPPWLAERIAPDLKGWSRELFDRKVEQLSRILRQMNGGKGPDILGVCEVENRFVLEQLAQRLNEHLPARRYAPVHADASHDQRGVDTALLYDSARVAPVHGTSPRPPSGALRP